MKKQHSPHLRRSILLCTFTVLLMLTGCGKNKDIEIYKTNMTQFFENISILNDSINNLDPESENVSQELLPLLDSLEQSFTQMASLEVPEDFPGVTELAQDADKYMSEAVSYYHQAYENGEYDKTAADIAYQNYQIANSRLQYIIRILHGDIPEEIFTYEDDAAATDPADADDQSTSSADPSAETGEVSTEDEEYPENWEEDEFAY